MNLPSTIALRYLLAKKSHGAVGTISTVSVCAMAIATAAIICVLSVFNGFREVIGARLDTLSPDIMVTPVNGKTFASADSLADALASVKGVEVSTATLTDNALLIIGQQEMPVTLKGVDAGVYDKVTQIRNIINPREGEYLDSVSEHPAVLSIGAAARLSAYPGGDGLLFAPRRHGRVNLANPAASFLSDSIHVSGIYRAEQSQFDNDGVIVPIDLARSLLQYEDEASAIEIRLAPGANPDATINRISKKIGDKYLVRDRLQQQEMNFRMISIEKWVSFLLLGFILLIASFNIISSLSMLVLDKRNALPVLSAMGMSRQRIGRVFFYESLYVAFTGGLAGIALGVALSLLQQHFGLITIGGDPGATIVSAYPVRLDPNDIIVTLIPIAIIGLLTALVTAAFARTQLTRAQQQ